MKKYKSVLILISFSLLTVLFSGCKTAPPVIPDGLSQPEFFQRAQEQSDNGRWDNAMIYYETFLRQYPNDMPNVLAARYEIAFLLYKKGLFDESKKGFQDLLETYKGFENPLSMPQWPRVLSEKLLKIIDEKTQPLLSGAK